MTTMEIKKSVREFIELLMRTGSIDNRFSSNARAIEGIRAHQKLQKSNEELYDRYEKEVFLETNINMKNFNIHLEGRCDGIIFEGSDIVVEEIKSTYRPLGDINEEYNLMHWAQGKIYGYIICESRTIDEIYVQLSYYNLDNNEVKSFRNKYNFKELKDFVYGMADLYKRYADTDFNHKLKRNLSINELNFPFGDYRKGQLELARAWYGTIKEKKKLFAQAPTGIGKTVSTIFPSVKAIGAGLGDRVFYLTAKNVNRKVAEDTFDILRKNGLNFRTVSLMAKEKICLNDKVSCNPEECIYAFNYYEKFKECLFKILDEENISYDVLQGYGEKFKICPFELSLELVEWSDAIICDYNYIFDPRVYLRRVLDNDEKENIVLVDESHNLVSRGRDMYTARIFKSKFLDLRKVVKGKAPSLYKIVNRINSYFIDERRNCEEQDKKRIYSNSNPKELCKLLKLFIREADEILANRIKVEFYDMLLDIYFDSNNFISISEEYGNEYVTYIDTNRNEVEICLFCVNPANKLKATMDKCRSTILFSATLFPFEYFMKLLGGNIDDYRLRLTSPFPKENLQVYLSPENTRYIAREKTLPIIGDTIIEFIQEIKGNYIVFLPSYEYMNKLYDYIKDNYSIEDIIIQTNSMNEDEKEQFLNQFSEESNKIALCVIGGVFSEGIDLPGKRLIGSVIVGVGYPRISFEGEIIKEHFGVDGEKIAYVYPGINKVMQAVGRVIRTENDIGRVLLIDDRYNNKFYNNLLPNEWKPLLKYKKKL